MEPRTAMAGEIKPQLDGTANGAFCVSHIELTEIDTQRAKTSAKLLKYDGDTDKDTSGCVKVVARLQGAIGNCYKSNRRAISVVSLGSLLALWLAYVIAAAVIDVSRSVPLLVGTGLLLFGIIYYKLIKPALSPAAIKLFDLVTDHCERAWTISVVRWTTYGLLLTATVAFFVIDTWSDRRRLMSLVGLIFFIVFLYVFSTNPAKVKWRPVLWGLFLQFAFGFFVLRVQIGQDIFNTLAKHVNIFLSYTDAGTEFVYGFLITPPNICGMEPVFAFKALNTVVFFSAVLSCLYYLGVMQWAIRILGGFMQMTLGTTAAESMSAAGNIFVGQTEAPLLIQPYLSKMTMSEIAAIMTGGFATIAGTVFQVYVSFGACGNHLLSASVMSAPAALAVAKLFYPETEVSKTKDQADLDLGEPEEKNFLEAAASGACRGIQLVANIIANLIAFFAFLTFVNASLDWLGSMVNIEGLTFERICSYLFFPLAYIMGASTDPAELMIVAELMGVKTFVNEFIAYQKMGEYIDTNRISPRARLISTYALCGFSNFTSVGIQLGGLGAMCPERKSDFARIAIRCLIGGSIACFMTACVAGLFNK
uniref:Sodium/nucleoside cotransporter n=1 Tax=Plectus sambesii TaxID=2011161 RepID=A0A914V0N5_9BILA